MSSTDTHPYFTSGDVDRKGTVEKQASNRGQSNRGLCEGCGIRTHSIAAFNQKIPVNNVDVRYGVCVRCHPTEVPPSARKAWEEKQKEGNSPQVLKNSNSSSAPALPVANDSPPPKPRPSKITDQDRRAELKKQGICPDCGIVRTHNKFNHMPLKNEDCHYGVCVGCRPNDVLPAVYRAWEKKQELASTNAVFEAEELKSNSADSKDEFASKGKLEFPKMASTRVRLADRIIEEERREALEKQGLCPSCGIKTHTVSRFHRSPLKNGAVHYGVCIKCNPESVMPSVRKAWEDKLKSCRDLGMELEDSESERDESDPVVPKKEVANKQPKDEVVAVPDKRSDKDLELWVKEDTPVSLGWNLDERHVFHHVIPFCSSTRRSKQEKKEDKEVFGGINRCVFSNLFVDDETLYVAPDAEFMGHAAQFSEGLCAESFYMAAKCKHECDAKFIMNNLKKSAHIERFCHNRLQLTLRQKHLLIDYGADPSDFRRADDMDIGPEDPDSKWFRWAGGKMPVRSDWYAVRHQVVLYIARHKFGGDRGYVTQKTVQALCTLICDNNELPIMVEHRKKDGFWGDAQNGSGFSILGKVITQVFLEITGVAASAPFLSKSQASRQLCRPNTDLVDYDYPESEDEEESDEGGNGNVANVPYDLKSGKPLRRVSGDSSKAGSSGNGPVVQYDLETGEKVGQ